MLLRREFPHSIGTICFWLVVSAPLKIWVRQLGWFFPMHGKNHVPNHQSVFNVAKTIQKKQWNWEFPHSVGTIEMGCLIIIRVMGLLFIGWDLRPTYRPFDQHGRGQRFLVTDAEDQRLALKDFWDFREVCGNVMKQQNPRISPLGILMYFIGISCLVKSCRWLNSVKSTLQSHFQAQSGHVDQDMGRTPCFSYPDPEVLKTFKRN